MVDFNACFRVCLYALLTDCLSFSERDFEGIQFKPKIPSQETISIPFTARVLSIKHVKCVTFSKEDIKIAERTQLGRKVLSRDNEHTIGHFFRKGKFKLHLCLWLNPFTAFFTVEDASGRVSTIRHVQIYLNKSCFFSFTLDCELLLLLRRVIWKV